MKSARDFCLDGIGGGDFILFGSLGALFGPFALAFILFLGSVSGCVIFLVFRKGIVGDQGGQRTHVFLRSPFKHLHVGNHRAYAFSS